MSKTLSEKQTATMKAKGFQPGNRANPGGRPKMDPDLKSAFKGHGQEALDTLVATLRKPEARDADKIRAAEVILNRGYGMPTQSVQVDGQMGFDFAGALRAFEEISRVARDDPPMIEAVAVETPRKE